MDASAAGLLAAGFIGTTDTLVQVRELHGDPHSGSGGRGLAFTLAGGLSFEVLPDRGLDLGATWYAGQPVGWRSALGSPGPAPTPAGWLGRFGGGLLVTCGLDNIGGPRGSYGQHGSHHDTRAHDVAVTRVRASNGSPGVEVAGTIDSVEVFGRRVRVYRTIASFADTPAVHLVDTVVNEGAWEAHVPLLYHLNFGAPLVLPGTRIDVDAICTDLKEPTDAAQDWTVFPPPVDQLTEAVWRHTSPASVGGVATARVCSPSGLTAEVRWRTAELPDLIQWVFPARHSWALGIEPTNAPLWGPDRDTAGAGSPVLAPGESFQTCLTVEFTGG